MALLLNIASGKLSVCNCLSDGRTVEDVIAEIESLLSDSPEPTICERAKTLADEINTGESLVICNASLDIGNDLKEVHFPSPNPFVTRTFILYEVPSVEDKAYKITGSSNERRDVQLKIFNVTGRLVKTLVERDEKAGFYSVKWDGRDGTEQSVSSGIYFLKLSSQGIGSSTGDFNSTKKMTLIR